MMGQPVGAKEETKINLVRISDLDFLWYATGLRARSRSDPVALLSMM